jgi:hypothetical protein
MLMRFGTGRYLHPVICTVFLCNYYAVPPQKHDGYYRLPVSNVYWKPVDKNKMLCGFIKK